MTSKRRGSGRAANCVLAWTAVLASTHAVLQGCGAHGLEILAPTAENISSSNFGRYFGAQTCQAVEGYVTPLIGDDRLCGPPFENDYKNLILIVPDFVYAIDVLSLDSGDVPWYTAGCTKEEMFEKIVGSGAIGAISNALDPLPSLGEFYHGAKAHDPEIYGKIPFVSVQASSVFEKLLGPLSGGQFVQVRISCDTNNPMLPYLEAVSILTLVCGVLSVLLGVFGIAGVLELTGGCGWAVAARNGCCSSSRSSHRHSTSSQTQSAYNFASASHSQAKCLKKQGTSTLSRARNKAARTSVIGQAAVLGLYSAIELLLGVCHILGMGTASNHSYILGDDVISFSAKTIVSTGFAGLKLFAVFVVALYWQEMAQALREIRLPRNVFVEMPWRVLFGALVFIIPDFCLVGLGASYKSTDPNIGLWMYSSLILLAACFFLFSVWRLLRDLNSHMSTMMTEGQELSRSQLQLQRFTFHMAKYLRIFALCSFISIATLLLFLPTGFYFDTPAAMPAFNGILMTTALLSSFSIVKGIRGPGKDSRRERTAPEPKRLENGRSDLENGQHTEYEKTCVEDSFDGNGSNHCALQVEHENRNDRDGDSERPVTPAAVVQAA